MKKTQFPLKFPSGAIADSSEKNRVSWARRDAPVPGRRGARIAHVSFDKICQINDLVSALRSSA